MFVQIFNLYFMISVNQVSVVFGGFYLLDSISFLINKKDRIGLTGRNGAGKSTLLKILAGVQSPSEGNIAMASEVKIGYLPQTKVYTDGNTVREEAKKAFEELFVLQEEVERLNFELAAREDYESEGYLKLLDRIHEKTELLNIRGVGNMDKEVEVILKGLGFRPEDLERNCEEFSGGWRKFYWLVQMFFCWMSQQTIWILSQLLGWNPFCRPIRVQWFWFLTIVPFWIM